MQGVSKKPNWRRAGIQGYRDAGVRMAVWEDNKPCWMSARRDGVESSTGSELSCVSRWSGQQKNRMR